MANPSTHSWTRSESLRRLAEIERFDVLVVGGGVLGAASAHDAASRGMTVALVEQNDFAAETSSRSTKLIHGGIRYLPHFEFGLVREGLLEQKVLGVIADYLYSPLDFVLPIYRDRGMADLPWWASNRRLLPLTLRMGLTLYDTLGSRQTDRHRKLDKEELEELVPTLRADQLRSGFLYTDAQTDDARLTVALLKTAVRKHGAVAVNGVRADAVDRVGDGFSVTLKDVRGNEEFPIHARSIVSATWAFRPPSVEGGSKPVSMVLSKGVHLLFDPAPLGVGDRAVVLPETEDGRVMFIVPWRGMALLGTTDTPYDGPPGDAVAEDEDIDYLLRHLHSYLDVPDVEPYAAFAGVRALVDDGESTAKASRSHQIVDLAPGYVQVIGGKLTAHRPIAADAIDRIAQYLGIDRPSTTAGELLVGAGLEGPVQEKLSADLAPLGFGQEYACELLRRYGTEASTVVALLTENPDLRETIGRGLFTLAEVLAATRFEAADSLADVALRRTHLSWVTRDHGRAAADKVAKVMAIELGWSPSETNQRLSEFEAVLASERL